MDSRDRGCEMAMANCTVRPEPSALLGTGLLKGEQESPFHPRFDKFSTNDMSVSKAHTSPPDSALDNRALQGL